MNSADMQPALRLLSEKTPAAPLGLFLSASGIPLRNEPLVGKQFIEAVVRVGADAREQIARIGEGLDA